MLRMDGNNIIMKRGDTVSLRTIIYTCSHCVYEIKKEDKVTFYLYTKDNNNIYENCDNPPIFKKDFTDRNLVLYPQDTQFFMTGEYYYTCVIVIEDGTKETYLQGKFFLI